MAQIGREPPFSADENGGSLLTWQKEAPSAAANEYLAEKERKAALRKLRARFSQVEKELSTVEAEAAEVEAALCDPETASDYQKAAELSAQLETLRARSDALSEEWLTLGEALEQ